MSVRPKTCADSREGVKYINPPYELLADEDSKACKLFDVIHEKSLYGRKYRGIVRSTFLLDGAGVLRREWRNVKVAAHAEIVLEAAQSI
jgi:peroxiredoxin Q/BCP